jgi:hypothetical protein
MQFYSNRTILVFIGTYFTVGAYCTYLHIQYAKEDEEKTTMTKQKMLRGGPQRIESPCPTTETFRTFSGEHHHNT